MAREECVECMGRGRQCNACGSYYTDDLGCEECGAPPTQFQNCTACGGAGYFDMSEDEPG